MGASGADSSSSGGGGGHSAHPKPDMVSHYAASALSAVLNFPLWCVSCL